MLEANQVYAAMGDQPLFKYPVRRVRWAGTVRQIRRYNWRAALIVHGLIIGFWALIVYVSATAYYSPNPYPPYYPLNPLEHSINYIGFLILLSIGMGIILDFACLVFSITCIGGKVSAGRWDLLRMTPIREESIVAAEHGLAQVRAWRVMALVLWTRTAAVILLLLHVFVLPILFAERFFLEDLFRFEFLNPLMALVTIGITLAIYVIEPSWRMRALTAVGIAISARVYHIVYAFLTAFAAMAIVWISQAIIMGTIGWFTVQFVAGFFDLSLYMCGVLAACIATAYIVRWYYVTVERRALEYATQRVYHEASR